jgi:hypothetical protein
MFYVNVEFRGLAVGSVNMCSGTFCCVMWQKLASNLGVLTTTNIKS